MKAKEYLSQLRNLDFKINHKIKELNDLKGRLFSTQGVDYSVLPDAGKTASTEARFVVKITDIEERNEEVIAEIDRYVDLKHEIINQIHQLSCPISIELLFKRYVEFKRFEVIAVEMHYSYNRIRHLHRIALNKFENRKDDTQ